MEKKYKRTTVTSALPYANGPVHIGHLAGVYVPADIYVRYLRLKGEDVVFIGGSDEHGVPVTIRARKEGITPQDVVDRYHKIIKDSFAEFGISFDIYSRTTSKTHHKVASDFFRTLYEKNEFVEQTSEQYYDEEAKQFLADRYIVGECPRCHAAGAYGDQCEKCGSTLSPEELINPVSKLSGSKPVKRPTKHWFLPLNRHQDWLKKWILEDHKEWRSNVYGQCKSHVPLLEIWNGVYQFQWKVRKAKCYMYGLMLLLDISATQKSFVNPIQKNMAIGRSGGRIKTLV